MPKYLTVTPTYTPISFQDRLKPLEAYVDTYNKITEDSLKTEGLLDATRSMLDPTKPGDAALLKELDTFQSDMSGVADNIASGNLNNMMSDALKLKRGYMKNFAKVPLAYAAKQEAIKNSKLPASWLGDRPEYHGTSDFIGTTPVFKGMDSDDVYKTAKDVMGGIAEALENVTPWGLDTDLAGQYFVSGQQSGTPEEQVANFLAAMDKSGLYADVPISEKMDYADKVTKALNAGFNKIVSKYNPTEVLEDPQDLIRFKSSVLAGMQAGAKASVKQEHLANKEDVGFSRRSSSSNSSNSTITTGDDEVNTSPFTGSFAVGNTKAMNKTIQAIDSLRPYIIDGKQVYMSDNAINKYKHDIEYFSSDEGKRTLLAQYYDSKHIKSANDDIATAEQYIKDRNQFIELGMTAPIGKSLVEDKIAEIKKSASFEDELLHTSYDYLNLDGDFRQNALTATLANKRAAVRNVHTHAIQAPSESFEKDTIKKIAVAAAGVQTKKSLPSVIKEVDKKTFAEASLGKGDAKKVLDDMTEKPENFSIISASKYGILIVDNTKDRAYYVSTLETDKFKNLINKLETVKYFSKTATGINKQEKVNGLQLANFIKAGNLPSKYVKSDNSTHLIDDYYVHTFNTGNDIVRVITDGSGRIKSFGGNKVVQSMSDYANGNFSTAEAAIENMIETSIVDVLSKKTK